MRSAISQPKKVPNVGGFSRRQILQTTGVALGSLVGLLATIPMAVAKMAQKAAGYQTAAKNGQSCATCALFKAPSSCTLVDGTITPDGWCRFYSKKTS
jgi:High potential iron-sulfur protein